MLPSQVYRACLPGFTPTIQPSLGYLWIGRTFSCKSEQAEVGSCAFPLFWPDEEQQHGFRNCKPPLVPGTFFHSILTQTLARRLSLSRLLQNVAVRASRSGQTVVCSARKTSRGAQGYG